MLGVYIGRFQPFHNAHLGVALKAFRRCDRLLFVLGSAQEARTPKNPFTVLERSSMIQASLQDTDLKTEALFEGVEDHPDDSVWCEWVRNAVAKHQQSAEEIVLFGAEKDNTAYYLRSFPQWNLQVFPVELALSATEIRKRYLAGEVFEHLVQGGTSAFLHKFAQTPEFLALAQ
jgi:bifunctional NMN adenylyltransferase/nudix hydrolase